MVSHGKTHIFIKIMMPFVSGDQHRKQRKMLNPVFSTANMKEMGRSPLFIAIPLELKRGGNFYYIWYIRQFRRFIG